MGPPWLFDSSLKGISTERSGFSLNIEGECHKLCMRSTFKPQDSWWFATWAKIYQYHCLSNFASIESYSCIYIYIEDYVTMTFLGNHRSFYSNLAGYQH